MKRLPLLLALPALLLATDLLVKAAVLGVIALLTLLACSLALATLPRQLDNRHRALASLLCGALCIGSAELLLQTLSTELATALRLSLPLLALPCLALAVQGESSLGTTLRSGLALLAAALLLGTLREGLGQGSLLAHADWLPGSAFTGWQLYAGQPLLTQAAGAFILLGLLLALLRHYQPEKAR